MLEVIENMHDERIKNIFEKQGCAAEHNYHHYLNVGANYRSCAFFLFEKKYGIMGFMDDGTVWCYSNPLAPKSRQAGIFLEFVEWAFSRKIKKIRAELGEELWQTVIRSLPGKYRAIKPSFIYFWPVFDLQKWDPALSGKGYKKLRNLRNRFVREHEILAVEKGTVSDRDILELIKKWKAAREGNDRVFDKPYISAVKNNFAGYDAVRFIKIDGILRIVNGGWRIKNTNIFYSQLGIHDYSLEGLGEFSYLEDMESLKGMGYSFADFGGSTEAMLNFKKKFVPAYIYKTVEFSIMKNAGSRKIGLRAKPTKLSNRRRQCPIDACAPDP